MKTYRYRIVDDIKEFRSLRSSWDRLAEDNFFHQWSWMYRWWESFQHRGNLSIVLVEKTLSQCECPAGQLCCHTEVVGIAPWYLSDSLTQGKVVQNLTAGETCSDYQSLLAHPEHLEGVTDILSDLICDLGQKSLFSGIDLFQIEGHRQQDPIVNKLMLAVEEKGGQASSHQLGGTWRTKLEGDWESFQKSIRSSFRRKTRKAAKRLGDSDFQFSSTSTAEQLQEAWPEFVKLHQKRRQTLGEPGCFADHGFERFLKSASLDLAKENKARLNSVSYQGKPIAMTLEFLPPGEVWMYQSGADTDFMSLEPGHLVFTASMMQALGEQRQSFDFLRGDEPYKSRWNAQRHTILTTKLVPNRLISRCRFQLWNTKNQLKSWTKKVIGSK